MRRTCVHGVQSACNNCWPKSNTFSPTAETHRSGWQQERAGLTATSLLSVRLWRSVLGPHRGARCVDVRSARKSGEEGVPPRSHGAKQHGQKCHAKAALSCSGKEMEKAACLGVHEQGSGLSAREVSQCRRQSDGAWHTPLRRAGITSTNQGDISSCAACVWSGAVASDRLA